MDEIDWDKVDTATLALLYLTLHDTDRAWKGFDWDTLDRLAAKGWIDPPRGKVKSVRFTEAGLERSAKWFQRYFERATSERSDDDEL